MRYTVGDVVLCIMIDSDVRSHAVCRTVPCVVLQVVDEDWGSLGMLRSYDVRAARQAHWPVARVWPSSLAPMPRGILP